MSTQNSVSEDHGVVATPVDAKWIYSIGVSTNGEAEIRMAESHRTARIVATTIDEDGLQETTQIISTKGLLDRIELKIEDITKPLPYRDNEFDYIYSRLVFHYLSEQDLISALNESYRILKPQGKIFVVVQSVKNLANNFNHRYDPKSKMHTFETRPTPEITETRSRFFHTEEGFSKYMASSGFKVDHSMEYFEQLFHDYERKIKAGHKSHLIEVIAHK